MKRKMQTQGSPKYKKIVIWYFSGTGNARFAAEQIKANAHARKMPTEVHNIAKPREKPQPAGKDTLVGFCYPTHGFNAPPVVLDFIRNYPRGQANTFLLNTRAGLKLSKLHLPGLGGVALWLPALMLWFKGYKPVGFRPLDMPSNWLFLHPGLRKKVVDSIKTHCTKTLATFTGRLLKGKPVFNGFLWLPVDLLLAPVALGYYYVGRFLLAKTLFASTSCNNCGACIKECPVKAIVEKDGRPYWTYKCESCMHCANICPHRAIETAHGYTFLLWWVAFSVLPYLLVKALAAAGVIIPEDFAGEFTSLVYFTLLTPFFLAVVFTGYRFLHWLLGFKTINKIITYASLSRFKWWRRYRLRPAR